MYLTLDNTKILHGTKGVQFRIHIISEDGTTSVYRVQLPYGERLRIFYKNCDYNSPGVDRKVQKTAYVIAERYF